MGRCGQALGLAILTPVLHLATLSAVVAQGNKPHVLFILADDYGWANFGIHRQGDPLTPDDRQAKAEIHTHNLDSLAKSGILLERHYSYKICSPSRSSLQSGRLAVHVNTQNAAVTVQNQTDPVSGWAGIPRNMPGMAEKMLEAGYRTHMVGKWDAGMATPEHTPQGRGYETWLGYFQHANEYWGKGMSIESTGELDTCFNMFTDLFEHNSTYRGGVRDAISLSDACKDDEDHHPACYEEELFKQRALSIIQGHNTADAQRPLFLFYAFHLLHTPLQVPKAFVRKIERLVQSSGGRSFDTSNRRLLAAMILYMDEVVGELVAALKAKSMWENSLVVFISDNGGPVYIPGSANNHPLKGGKYNDWEGGVRTNAFMSGGFIPEHRRGSKFHGVISIADWYGTLSEIAGVDFTDARAEEANKVINGNELSKLRPVDSVPQWGFIMNATNGRPGPLHLSSQAVLQWPFKLVTGKQPYSRWQGTLFPNCSTIAGAANDEGPMFSDFKVFNENISPSDSQEETDKLLWVQDCGEGCLVNVEADPTEHINLARDPNHQKVLLELQRKLSQMNELLFLPQRGKSQLKACLRAVDNGGYYGPFVDVDNWYTPVPPAPSKRASHARQKAILYLIDNKVLEYGGVALAKGVIHNFRPLVNSVMDKCIANQTYRRTREGPAQTTIVI